MDDLIRRGDAIEVADAVWSVTGDKNVAKIWDQLKDLPSAQPEQRWIPVTERERLPLLDAPVLLCDIDGCIEVGKLSETYGGVKKWKFATGYNDIDDWGWWMPLPELPGRRNQ